ncbi:PRC-barrel domain containing protein [Bacillus sp. HMF5848]|uniref:PRC-barrel domain-containing protein n=1 Tax=Bacillus sp. HMF5848 TaxID=2495421 RepID=UPI000F7AE449|nr:PRC-barrel domain-containing protein [Bacillus sp. HMF5848]RSK28785.1 PRC-barrel domain containing protein [Bacillus sp. HMF5848]
MLHQALALKNFNIEATDGSIGEVFDFFFDDKSWTIRYLVIDTMKWLPGRKVLFSPIEFDEVDLLNQKVSVFASKDKIKNSPDVYEHRPVSREHEIALSDYYGWSYYWTGTQIWGNHIIPYDLKKTTRSENELLKEKEGEQNHMRSVKEITGVFSGYRIHARNGEIGHVSDMIIDDETWEIRYIIVDTNNWLPGKKVLVATDWITDLNWPDKTVTVDIMKDSIKNAPEYDPTEPLSKQDEEKLYHYYNKAEYSSQL